MPIGENFDTGILDQIKEKHIKPKARWTFLLKDYVVWAFGFVSLMLGAVAFSVIIYVFKNNDWELYKEFSGSIWEFVILTMPYFWIIFLAIFIVILDYDIKHTKQGYKLSLPVVIFTSVLISIFFGILFFNAGLGQKLDDILGEKITFYDRVINPMVRMWDDPENGRLAGLVIADVGSGQYRLLDIGRNEWLIDVNQAQVPRNIIIEIGRPIKLLGRTEGQYFFIVKQVILHDGPGRGMMMHRLKDGIMPPPMFLPPPEMCASHQNATNSDEGVCPMEKIFEDETIIK